MQKWLGWQRLRGSFLKRRDQPIYQRDNTQNFQNEASKQQLQAIAWAINQLNESQKAKSKEQDRKEKKKFRLDMITAIGIWIYTGFTLIVVVISYCGLRYAAQSTWFAQVAAGAALQQATINRAHLWIRVAPENPSYGKDRDDGAPYIRIKFTITNYGESPAILTGFRANSIIDGDTEVIDNCPIKMKDFDPFFSERVCGKSTYTDPLDINIISNGIINHRTSSEISAERPEPWGISSTIEKNTFVSITKEFEFSIFPKSTKMPFVLAWAYITYRDIYGIDRRTSIYVKIPGGAPSEYHPEYNCWDDGCPKQLPAVMASYR